jgi:hypothetical protein
MPIIYHYFNPETKEYLYTSMNELIINTPENATDISPDMNEYPSKKPVWNGETWNYLEDHRGRYVYDTNNTRVLITELGSLPEGYSLTYRESEEQIQRKNTLLEIQNYKSQLVDIDEKSIRALRADRTGGAISEDYEILNKLENDAINIRNKLSKLENDSSTNQVLQ